MKRYVTMPRARVRAEYDDDVPLLPSLTVYEADNSPVDTGLVDHHGDPIMAVYDRSPIGFIEFSD